MKIITEIKATMTAKLGNTELIGCSYPTARLIANWIEVLDLYWENYDIIKSMDNRHKLK